jgi:hypothetical protein
MAATDSGRPIKNAPWRCQFTIKNITTWQHVAGAGGLAGTIAGDGGAPGATSGTPTENSGSAKVYYVDLSAANMSFGEGLIRITTTTGSCEDVAIPVRTESGLDSGVAQAGGSNTIRLRSGASSRDDFYMGCAIELVRGNGAGQVRTITDYVGTSKQCTLDAVWDSSNEPDAGTVYIVHPRRDGRFLAGRAIQSVSVADVNESEQAAENLANLYDEGLVNCAVNDTTPTTTEFVMSGGDLNTTDDDFYATCGSMVLFRSGALKSIANRVTAYDASTLTFSFAKPWPVAPANGDDAVIIGHVE